jgi:hypothetical protein
MPANFFLAAAFGLVTIASVLMIPKRAIDLEAARRLENGDDGHKRGGKAEGFRVLVHEKLMLILASALAFFILGGFALVSLGLWFSFAGTLRPACAGMGGIEPARAK